MILLWGLADERPLAAVRAALARAGVATGLVDQRATLATEVELWVGGSVEGRLSAPGLEADLSAVAGVYARPYDLARLPELAGADRSGPEWQRAREVEALLWTWLEVAPATVLNRPAAMATNSSKPYQLELIRRHGFAVPETLLTTDPEAAAAFWEQHGQVIYKSISAVRSAVSRLGREHADRLADVATCPTQFQQYVPGRDYRVHVVGEELFASEIVSEADDYRYPGQRPVAIRQAALPPDVADRCRRLAAALRLPLAGVDLRLAETGDWFCFEVNPSPAFTYYQEATGQPIDDAIARHLTGA